MNASLLLLQPYLQTTSANERCLLVADENLIDISFTHLGASTQVVSNRFDIAHQAQLANCQSHFNDFDFSVFPNAGFTRVVYRVSKEKLVAHHIINHSLRLLADEGELILFGAKNEGIKTYASKAAAYFNTQAIVTKRGNDYLATIRKNSASQSGAEQRVLPLKRPYESLTPIIDCTAGQLFSKPGLFGWNKIDRGSALLSQHLKDFFAAFTTPPQSLLDLGCGYGYLSVMAAQRQTKNTLRIVATDNCAAATTACQKNFAAFNIDGEVIADDCASSVSSTFDALLCNPPFHQGFKTDTRLTEKFVETAAQRVKDTGRALFVVNQFVPLERIAQTVFARSEKIAQADGFKLLVLSHQ